MYTSEMSVKNSQPMKSLPFTVVLVFVLLVVSAHTLAMGTDDGAKAYHQGDYPAALRILEPMAENGNYGSKYYLGEMYFKGAGVKQDHAKAAKFFLEAAEGNYYFPQRRLGDVYKAGLGVPQDSKIAYMWYEIASSLGDKLSSGERDEVGKQLSSKQITEAKAMAKEWLKDHRW